jgi:UDP-N-acetylglucosamine 2-epimerase
MYGHNSVCARNHPGYDERQVRQLVVSALEALSAETAGKIHLVVRPHPREHVEEFFCLNSARIRVRLARDERVHELVLSADLVVGMSSALLVEACYLGCITLSVQPGLQTADVLPTNASGLSRAVYRAEGVLPAIREMMLNPTVRQAMQARLATFQPDGRATERVLGQAFEMFGQPSARIRS